MTLTLKNPSIQKLIDDRISTGEYASAEEVIIAALVSLEQREQARDFSTNDLNGLLDVGIQQIDRGDEGVTTSCQLVEQPPFSIPRRQHDLCGSVALLV